MIEENAKLLEAFVSNLKTSGRSGWTVSSYKREVREFLEYLGDKPFIDIDYADCEDYRTYLNDKGNSTGTMEHKRSALSTFSKYVKRRYGKSIDLDNHWVIMDALPKERVKPLVIWNKQKVLDIIEYYQDKDLRLSTMLALALYSGRRKAELTRFKVSDFSDDRLIGNGKFWATEEIKTKGRGSHKMNCFILTDFKPYLDRWLKERPVDSDWLFPNQLDASKHISEYTMTTLADKVKRIHKDFHWHMIRHTMVTSMLDDGIDANIVVRIIGWSDIKMLNVYDDRDKINVIDKYFSGRKYG